MTFEAICPENRERINRFIEEHWFTTTMVVRGREIDMTRVDGGEIVGLATFLFYDGLCEIVSLDSLRENQGIGTALLTQALAQARQRGCADHHQRQPARHGLLPEAGLRHGRAVSECAGRFAATEAGNTGDWQELHSAAARDRV